MGKEIQVEHFINDLKYVVASLKKDKKHILSRFKGDILEIDPTAMKMRFALDYEGVLPLYEKLHIEEILLEVEKSLHHYEKLCRLFTHEYGFIPIRTMAQIEQLKKTLHKIRQTPVPTYVWFQGDAYDEIKAFMGEVQTKAEDCIRSKKRIEKVWNPEVFHNDAYEKIQAFLKTIQGNLKYLSGTYWKHRKWLYSLFIEDKDLLTSQEIEVLYHNLSLYKESDDWLAKHDEEIATILGQTGSFEEIRCQYEAIYEMLDLFQKENKEKGVQNLISPSGFYTFYQTIQLLSEINVVKSVELLQYLFPINDINEYCLIDIAQLHQKVQHSIEYLNRLHQEVTELYQLQLNQTQELTISDIKRTIYTLEKIQSKNLWLNQNEEMIRSLFGSIDIYEVQDWTIIKDQMRKKEYGFAPYQSVNLSDVSNINEIFHTILSSEQPILLQQLLKQAANASNLRRVTTTLKDQFNLFLQSQEQFEVVEEFVECKDKSTIAFRLPRNDEEKRDISCISKNEWKAGILRVITVQKEITLDNISKEMSIQLKLIRRNKSFQAIIENTVRELKKEGWIQRYSGGWRIVE